MGTEETHALGYERVDDDPNTSVLLATMDATARWEATLRLREWERHQLRLKRGQRLLDVGCGLGDAALALAADLGETGELVGVDVSNEMVTVARPRAIAARCQVRFSIGDAVALDEPDGYFDVVRSERTLQWITDPEAAVAEMARVLRPGGLVSLVDTDWSTFAIDVGDDDLAGRVREAMRAGRARPSKIGSRLPDLVRSCGFELVAGPRRPNSGTGGTPTSHLHQMGASLCRASPTTSSRPVSSRPANGKGSCRRSTKPPATTASRWRSRCSPSSLESRRPLADLLRRSPHRRAACAPYRGSDSHRQWGDTAWPPRRD